MSNFEMSRSRGTLFFPINFKRRLLPSHKAVWVLMELFVVVIRLEIVEGTSAYAVLKLIRELIVDPELFETVRVVFGDVDVTLGKDFRGEVTV